MDTDYDVIVAGGGLTGTVAAQAVSHYSNQNLSILSIDRNPENLPGRKSNPGWTCGDACSKEAVDFMTERIKVPWTSPEIEHDVKGVMAFSPDKETAIPFDGEGYMLNRQKLPEIQNARTKKMGVNFDFEINLTSLIYDGPQVIGVQGINNKTKQPYKKTAKVVVDATGVTSMLRNQLENSTKVEKKIDRIHLPKNCLDVLSQQIYGIVISEQMHIDELFKLIKNSYSFHDIKKNKFDDVIDYLSGKYVSLESRHIYAKMWYDKETGMVGKRGKLARVIYMTNIGTIPDESFVTVKVGDQIIGKIDEGFLEKLRRGDVFVLGGEKYEFKFARGMTAQVNASVYRPPTIPSWVSEMLPLSFDLAVNIGKFRRLMEDRFEERQSKKDIIDFINHYLYVDKNSANSIYQYFNEQYSYAYIPSDKKLVVEFYNDENNKHIVFHSLYGRRVNDVLSRAIAYIISKMTKSHVEIGISDNGFLLTPKK
ncbi:MAG: hypothetical protein VB736_00265, partial [Candidatus Nitrosopelagicus sp.]